MRRRSSRQAASVSGRRAWTQGSSPQPGSAHLAQAARSEGSLPPALWPRSLARAERRRPGATRRRAAAAHEDRPSTRGLHPGPRWCDRNQSFFAAAEDLGERILVSLPDRPTAPTLRRRHSALHRPQWPISPTLTRVATHTGPRAHSESSESGSGILGWLSIAPRPDCSTISTASDLLLTPSLW